MTYPPPPQDPNAPQDPNEQPPGYGYPPPGYPPPGYPPPGYPSQAYPQQPAYGPPGYMPPPPPGMPPYGMQGAPVPGGRLASMGARFGALVLDSVILAVPGIAIVGATGGFHSSSTSETCDASGACTTNSFSFHIDLTPILIGLLIGVLYYGYMVGVRTQTWGQQAAGIRVVDVNTGNPIGFGRGTWRWVVLVVTGELCTLGYWSPFFDSTRRQGWHDKAAKSVVIPAAGR